MLPKPAASTQPAAGSCAAAVEPDVAAAYLAGALTADQAGALASHLDGCAECRWLVYGAAATAGDGDGGDHDPADPVDAGAVDAALAGGTLPVGARLGRYQIVRPIGAGGMGVVYLAHDHELDRRVALKALRGADLAATARDRERMRAEARAIARVSHPNVVAIHELVEHGAARYLVMELVEGVTLDQWLAAAPRSPRAIVDAFVAAGAGLAAVHAAGLVHGDVKPANVLVGADGRVRLTDFGLARDHGVAALAGGTPAYMAPELAADAPATARSDQYAFCRALAGALAGRGGRRVRAALARGQAADPAARHGSMPALLAALAPRPWRGYAFAATGAVAALCAVWVYRGARARAELADCVASAPDAAAIWRRSRPDAERAFHTAAPGDDAWSAVARQLDAWTAAHRAQVTAACRATWADRTQSTRELTARLDCLAERARAAGALIGELAHAARPLLSRAVVAAATLEPASACAEPGRAPTPRPAGTTAAAQVDALRAELARIDAQNALGQAAATSAATAALSRAHALSFPPVIAEATLRLGTAQLGTDSAAETLLAAATLADGVGDDQLRARALVLALRADYEVGRSDRVASLAGQAAAALARSRSGPLAWAELHQAVGLARVDRDELAAAMVELGLAITLRASVGPAGQYLVARSLATLAIANAKRGAIDSALASFREVATLLEEELGPHHPRVGGAYLVLGQALLADLRPAEALPHLERAVADAGDELGFTASAESSLGFALTELGDPAAALAHHGRALAAWRTMRADHPRAALALLGEGQARIALRDFAGAVAALEAARALASRNVDTHAEICFALAVALTADGAPPPRALDLAREAAASYAEPGAAADPRNLRERDRAARWLAERAR